MSTEEKGGITATEVIPTPENDLVGDESLDSNELEAGEVTAPALSEEAPASAELDDSMDLELSGDLAESPDAPLAGSVESGMDMGDAGELKIDPNAPESADLEEVSPNSETAPAIDTENIALAEDGDHQEIAPMDAEAPFEPEGSDYDTKLREIDAMLADEGGGGAAPVDIESTNPNLDEAVAKLEQDASLEIETSSVEDESASVPSDPNVALSQELAAVGGDNLEDSIEVLSELEDDALSMDLEADDASVEAELASELDSVDDTSLAMDDLDQELSREIEAPPQNTKMFNLSALKGADLEDEMEAVAEHISPSVAPMSHENMDVLLHKDEQLLQLSSTVNFLRAERAKLQEEITSWEMKVKSLDKKVKDMRDQLDEKSIELDIVNKRAIFQHEEYKKSMMMADEKKSLVVEKNKRLEQEIQRLQFKDKIDINKIRQREQELENMLELLKADTQVQIQNRDSKIMDLKRKMDLLQFDLQSMAHKEKKAKESANMWQKKLMILLEQLKTTVDANEQDSDYVEPHVAERRKLTG